jgi:mannose-1-phosphate guanylyltransferase
MSATSHQYALILAGGSGTRFWPLSRDARPKQLLDLFGDGTLLEQTIRRLEGIVPVENILILTNHIQEAGVRAIASMLPPENILAEPAKRDTAPAVALGIGLITARDPQAVMTVLPSDQLIRDTESFAAVMRAAMHVASSTVGLVTIGIQPTWPCPSYGYIERGEAALIAEMPHGFKACEVLRFREKPDPETAAGYLRQGGFTWNAGMFVWSVAAVTAQLRTHTPELAVFIDKLAASPDPLATIAADFPTLPARSIDYALMEKADCVLNIEATFDWDDVGSWISIAKYLPAYGDENRSNAPLTEIDSNNNIVYAADSTTPIALLGVENLIVVRTPDALLVAHRDQADAIKKLTPLLPPELL